MGVKTLRRIQFVQEATAGTALTTATYLWRGTGLLKDDQVRTFPAEDIGQYLPRNRSYVAKEGATITLDETEADFLQLCYLFETGLEYVQTATAEGSGWLRQYDLPRAATDNTRKTLTVQGGDDQDQMQAEYVFPTQISLSGAAGEAVKVSGTLFGRQATKLAAFNPATPAPVAIEEILFGKGLIWVDASGGTIGTTTKSGTWLGFNLNINTGLKPLFTADGATYFYSTVFTGAEVTGDITWEHDATGDAEITAAQAGSTRLVRMQFEGTALGTAGSTYDSYTLRIDMAIVYTDVPTLSEDDGNDTVTIPFKVIDDSTATLGMQITMVNGTNTLS